MIAIAIAYSVVLGYRAPIKVSRLLSVSILLVVCSSAEDAFDLRGHNEYIEGIAAEAKTQSY